MFYLITHHIRTYNFIFYDGLSAQCQPYIIACRLPSKNVFPKYSITWLCRMLFSVYFSYTFISQEYAGLIYSAWMDSSHGWLFYAQFFGDSKINIYLTFNACKLLWRSHHSYVTRHKGYRSHDETFFEGNWSSLCLFKTITSCALRTQICCIF